MPVPREIMTSIYEDYVKAKQRAVELTGGPCNVGMRWVMDFGTNYTEWPYYNRARLLQEFDLEMPAGDPNGEPMLAIFDTDGSREIVYAYIAKLLTHLGPPIWVGVCQDAYRITPTPDELIRLIAEGIRDGDLARRREQLDESVLDVIVFSACHHDGDWIAGEQTYTYDDNGLVVLSEVDEEPARPAGGFLNVLMSTLVELGGKTPYETLVQLANGNEEEAQRIILNHMSGMN